MPAQKNDIINSDFLQLINCKLHYIQYGNGPKVAIAFHGYGNNATIFDFLHAKDFTVISVDLPHHGESYSEEKDMLTKNDLKVLVEKIMNKFKVQKVSLIGYSMGGRVSLIILELMPQQINNIVLLAPDGLRFNYFYYFLTRTSIGRFLFNDFTKRGSWYLNKITVIEKLKLINKSKYKFAVQQIKTNDARVFLRNAWNATNQLIPDLQIVKQIISTQQIPIHIIMGAFDKIIPLKHALEFKKNATNIQLHIIQKGHALPEDTEAQQMATKCLFGNTKNRTE
jgi:pimeloyl-ACP methyl ester carboxylesterase